MAQLHFSGDLDCKSAVTCAVERCLGARLIPHPSHPERFPYYTQVMWGWSEVHMPAHMEEPQIVVDSLWVPTAHSSAEVMTTSYGARFASLPLITITTGVDITKGQDIVRFAMGPLSVDNFYLEGWQLSMPVYSIYDKDGACGLAERLPGLLEPGLRILKEFMDAPAEVFGLPGEELPRVASLSLLIHGRDDRSPIQKWRQWLACQALQHYGEMEKVTWWHPSKETLDAMPKVAEKFARHMEVAV